ncbi:hypothetical protein [Cardinium endosymbiont of Philonthus spinipes]|uniref:hypothetical protein n=1 Tax=Cardinium endosymbiont of Philonthus spinipes TaxID=3077941 RepID=UPI00313BF8FA
MNLQVIIRKFSFILLIFGLNGNRNCTSQQKNIKLISGSKQQAIQARTISTSNPTDNPKETPLEEKKNAPVVIDTKQNDPNSNDKAKNKVKNEQSNSSDTKPCATHNRTPALHHSTNKSFDTNAKQLKASRITESSNKIKILDKEIKKLKKQLDLYYKYWFIRFLTRKGWDTEIQKKITLKTSEYQQYQQILAKEMDP